MKKTLVFTLALAMTIMVAVPAAFSQAKPKQEKTSPQLMKLAEQYYKASSFTDMLKKSMTPMLNQFPPERRENLKKQLNTAMSETGPLKNQILEATARAFTKKELKAMVKYYTSPEGQSILKKMPNYTKETSGIIAQVLMPIVQAEAMQLRAEMQKKQQEAMKKAQEEAKKAKKGEAKKPAPKK